MSSVGFETTILGSSLKSSGSKMEDFIGVFYFVDSSFFFFLENNFLLGIVLVLSILCWKSLLVMTLNQFLVSLFLCEKGF